MQEAKKWSKARYILKAELFAKHRPFYNCVPPPADQASTAAEPAGSEGNAGAGGLVVPERLVELAQLAEESLLDSESGKALSSFLVKNTSKRPCSMLMCSFVQ